MTRAAISDDQKHFLFPFSSQYLLEHNDTPPLMIVISCGGSKMLPQLPFTQFGRFSFTFLLPSLLEVLTSFYVFESSVGSFSQITRSVLASVVLTNKVPLHLSFEGGSKYFRLLFDVSVQLENFPDFIFPHLFLLSSSH